MLKGKNSVYQYATPMNRKKQKGRGLGCNQRHARENEPRSIHHIKKSSWAEEEQIKDWETFEGTGSVGGDLPSGERASKHKVPEWLKSVLKGTFS